MPDRRGSRFVLEVLFLLALAVALTLANLRPFEIAGIMLVGWVIVAALEWAAWRDEPHYGSGLPPRYYVPQVNLPPARPLEQVAAGYPETRDEAATWIAPAAVRAELLGDWPVAAPPVSLPEEPRELEPASDPDPWSTAEELPVAPLGELDPAPEPELDQESVPVPVPAPEPLLASELHQEPEPSLAVVLARSVQGIARYSLDPLADAQPRRRFSRGATSEPAALDVPARPEGARALPGRTNRQD